LLKIVEITGRWFFIGCWHPRPVVASVLWFLLRFHKSMWNLMFVWRWRFELSLAGYNTVWPLFRTNYSSRLQCRSAFPEHGGCTFLCMAVTTYHITHCNNVQDHNINFQSIISNNGYTKASQCYIMLTWPLLLIKSKLLSLISVPCDVRMYDKYFLWNQLKSFANSIYPLLIQFLYSPCPTHAEHLWR
jgi:hypothetical protein